MKPKTLIPLIIICLGLAWYGLKDDGSNRKVQGFKDPTPFKNLEFNSVDDVLIEKGDDRLHLTQSEGGWKAVSGELEFEADFSQLKKLLLEVRDIEWLSQPARNDRHDKHFGLDADSQPGKLELKADNKTILSLSLGKGRQSSKPSPFGFQPEQGQHMRVEGTPGVFFAKETLGATVSPGEWIDKTLAKTEVENITTVEMSSLGRNLTFSKEKVDVKDASGNITKSIEQWKAEGDLMEGLRFMPSKMDSWLSDLKEISVQEPVASTLRKDFPSQADHQITVKNGDDVLYSLKAQNIDDDWYLWHSSGKTTLFKASKYVVEEIFHKNTSLFNLDPFDITLGGNLLNVSWSKSIPKFKASEGKWAVDGTAPQPDVDETLFEDLQSTVGRIEVSNFFPGLKRESLNRLVVKGEEGTVVLDDLGPSPFSNTHLVLYKDIAYSIPKASHTKLFPEANKLLKQEASFEGISEIKTITLPNFKLEKRGKGKWFLGDDVAKTGSISDWLNTFKLTLKSPYNPSGEVITDPVAELLVEKDDGEILTLKIGNTVKGKTLAKYSGFSGTLDVRMELITSLNNDVGYFLDTAGPLKPEPAVTEDSKKP